MKNHLLDVAKLSGHVPGLTLAASVTMFSLLMINVAGKFLSWEQGRPSPVLVVAVLGLIVRNIIPLPQSTRPGLKYGITRLLRFGIILMGIRLSVFTVMEISLLAFSLVVVCLISALIITVLFARRIGISDRLGTLIAAGTSICGISAIVAVSPVINAREEETTYAVGTITIFGILATIIYPYLAELVLHLPVESAGFFIGTSIHDTSQVTAASLIYDQLWSLQTINGLTGADIAITTKLVRNTFLIVVIPLLGFWSARQRSATTDATRIHIMKHIPLFVFGYIIMGIIRTIGDQTCGPDHTTWISICQAVKTSAVWFITIAIASVGLSTDLRKISTLGYKPFLCGLVAALSVGLISCLMVILFGKYLTFG